MTPLDPSNPSSPSDTGSSRTLTVRCPTCGGPSIYAASNASRPFCSERCKNVDLGAWATESYRMPAAPGNGPDDSADTGAAGESGLPH